VRISTKEIFTIPNCLSYLRIVLLPFFVVFYLRAEQPADYLLPAGIILFSAITDVLAGFIARTFNQRSGLGTAWHPITYSLQ